MAPRWKDGWTRGQGASLQGTTDIFGEPKNHLWKNMEKQKDLEKIMFFSLGVVNFVHRCLFDCKN